MKLLKLNSQDWSDLVLWRVHFAHLSVPISKVHPSILAPCSFVNLCIHCQVSDCCQPQHGALCLDVWLQQLCCTGDSDHFNYCCSRLKRSGTEYHHSGKPLSPTASLPCSPLKASSSPRLAFGNVQAQVEGSGQLLSWKKFHLKWTAVNYYSLLVP